MKSRNYTFTPNAFEQLSNWIQADKKIAKRIPTLPKNAQERRLRVLVNLSH